MRRAGIISTILVLIAVSLGIYSLSDHFGLSASGILALIAPVAVGVIVLTVGLVFFGFWSVKKLNQTSEPTSSSDASHNRRS